MLYIILQHTLFHTRYAVFLGVFTPLLTPMLYLSHTHTPLGNMLMGATDTGICLFDFEHRRSIDSIINRIETHIGSTFQQSHHPYFHALQQQIHEYLAGTLTQFQLPLHIIGTPFQQQVWQALQQIPYGQTRSYKQQSVLLGNEKAIRAVAGANGENGIAIIIPCHRVIAENGNLTGYSGGLQTKKWLLHHERKTLGALQQGQLF